MVSISTIQQTSIPVFPNNTSENIPYNLNVEYTDLQSGRETIILLHGYMGSTDNYSSAFERLKHYNIIAIDLRGHGQSESPVGKEVPWLMVDLAYDVKQIIDMLVPGTEKVTVLASSLSTAIGLELAKEFPERIKRLMLLSPTSQFVIPPWIKLAVNIGKLAPDRLTDFFIDFMYYMLVHVVPSDNKEIYEKNYDRFKRLELSIHQKIIEETLSKWEADLETVSIPVLVMAGKLDKIVPYEDTVKVVESLPLASLVSMPKEGHFLLRRVPELVFDLLDQWITDTDNVLERKYYNRFDVEMNGINRYKISNNGNFNHIKIEDALT